MDVDAKYKRQFNEAMAEFLGFMEQQIVSEYSMVHWYEGLRFLLDMAYLESANRHTMWIYRWRSGEEPVLIKTVTISE